jgi:ubiquinone/menaquinone biosynthesis C-methylase UbiE
VQVDIGYEQCKRFLGEGTMRKWYHPKINLENIGIRAGMVFADIGCGYGFFTVPAAQIVGEQGKVYAVDIDASAIDRLKREVKEKGLKNVTATVGAAEETIFCDECADIVFYSIVLHDFRDPAKVLQNAKQMLKPTGTLVNLDWKKRLMPIGPPVRIRFSEEQASSIIEQAGFRIESVRDLGPNFYIVTAKPQSSL